MGWLGDWEYFSTFFPYYFSPLEIRVLYSHTIITTNKGPSIQRLYSLQKTTIIKLQITTIGTTGRNPKAQLLGIISTWKPRTAISPKIMEIRQLKGEIFFPYKAAITVGNNTAKPVKAWVAIAAIVSGGFAALIKPIIAKITIKIWSAK